MIKDYSRVYSPLPKLLHILRPYHSQCRVLDIEIDNAKDASNMFPIPDIMVNLFEVHIKDRILHDHPPSSFTVFTPGSTCPLHSLTLNFDASVTIDWTRAPVDQLRHADMTGLTLLHALNFVDHCPQLRRCPQGLWPEL